mgnify:CR=1 FL=1
MFPKNNILVTNDENAKSGISGTAIVMGKTADPEASKIYTPPVANAALTNAATKPPKVTIITDKSINLFYYFYLPKMEKDLNLNYYVKSFRK